MKRLGTITEFTNSGVGWIDLDTGERVRFGYSACRFKVPTVGMRVAVLRTEPGFRGVVKATAVEEVPGAPSPLPSNASVAALDRLDQLNIPVEPLLRDVVRRAGEDVGFRDDLARLQFHVTPMRAQEMDCPHTRLSIVATDGSGNAFGLFDRGAGDDPLPWVFWHHEDDLLTLVAATTSALMSRLLRHHGLCGDRLAVERVRDVLRSLGFAESNTVSDPARSVDKEDPSFLDGPTPSWLARLRS